MGRQWLIDSYLVIILLQVSVYTILFLFPFLICVWYTCVEYICFCMCVDALCAWLHVHMCTHNCGGYSLILKIISQFSTIFAKPVFSFSLSMNENVFILFTLFCFFIYLFVFTSQSNSPSHPPPNPFLFHCFLSFSFYI